MRKLALIIGNNEYEYMTKLNCAAKDAEDISRKLELLGFECICKTNVNYDSIWDTINGLQTELDLYEIGLVYFAGHGFEIEKSNYCAMIDTSLYQGKPVKHRTLSLDELIKVYDNSSLRTKIIILDACRDNFSSENRGSIINGFAPIFAPRGTIIAYSTSPGQKAMENKSLGNGIYTNALLQCLDIPRMPIESMFKKVREIVSTKTENNQIPWEHTSLLGDFSFNPDIANGKSISLYSNTALADSQYMFITDSTLKDIINDLKSHNWHTQNPAIDKISNISNSSWKQASVNEIFILGRNIYQSAYGGAFSAGNYIDDLVTNLNKLPNDVAVHLLTGIAFEIYFDKNGKIRNIFPSNYSQLVIEVLEQMKGNALDFIQKELIKYDDYVLYIPGSGKKYVFSVNLVYKEDLEYYELLDIFCNSQSILYDEDGTAKYDSDTDWYKDQKRIQEFEKIVSLQIASPINMIEFVYDKDINFIDDRIGVPSRYSFRWYGSSLKKTTNLSTQPDVFST